MFPLRHNHRKFSIHIVSVNPSTGQTKRLPRTIFHSSSADRISAVHEPGFDQRASFNREHRNIFGTLLKGNLSIKSHGLLVSLDSTPCGAYISDLSTWSSSRSLQLPYGKGYLILGWAWRLYAFSAYPFPTQLPCHAAGATTGALAVGPTWSSRTKVSSPQVSFARIR